MVFKMAMLKDVFPILVFLVALRLLKSQIAQWMIESIVTVRHLRTGTVCTAFFKAKLTATASQKLLQALNPVHDSLGKGISGPRWQYLNGQTLDKFLDGRKKVQEWQKYGPVYRIWAGTTPEMYVLRIPFVSHLCSSLHMFSDPISESLQSPRMCELSTSILVVTTKRDQATRDGCSTSY